MIVDDTATYRMILKHVLQQLPEEAQLVATANNGCDALKKLASMQAAAGDNDGPGVDLLLLDIEMPEMDGLATLREVRQRYPEISVVMVSAMNRTCADITIQALEQGAMEFIPKPDGGSAEENTQDILQRLHPILRLCTSHRLKHFIHRNKARRQSNPQMPLVPPTPAVEDNSARIKTTPPPLAAVTTSATLGQQLPSEAPSLHPGFPTPPTASRPATAGRAPRLVSLLVIGISTGGPNALNTFIPALPGDLGIPILLVQHMPPFFTASLAKNLDKKSALTVKEAESGEALVANTVYIAPGGRHMVLGEHSQGEIIQLQDDPPVHSCRPSVDVLFHSVARTWGTRMKRGNEVVCLVMTGMGTDGANGVEALRNHGAYCLTQSEASCVVYGMPRAVDELGLSHEQLDLDALAGRLIALCSQRR
jgi:two-component system chemotaxis response regulator CheB